MNDFWDGLKMKKEDLEKKLESQQIYVLYEPIEDIQKKITERK